MQIHCIMIENMMTSSNGNIFGITGPTGDLRRYRASYGVTEMKMMGNVGWK